jgi:hypothetical protein
VFVINKNIVVVAAAAARVRARFKGKRESKRMVVYTFFLAPLSSSLTLINSSLCAFCCLLLLLHDEMCCVELLWLVQGLARSSYLASCVWRESVQAVDYCRDEFALALEMAHTHQALPLNNNNFFRNVISYKHKNAHTELSISILFIGSFTSFHKGEKLLHRIVRRHRRRQCVLFHVFKKKRGLLRCVYNLKVSERSECIKGKSKFAT